MIGPLLCTCVCQNSMSLTFFIPNNLVICFSYIYDCRTGTKTWHVSIALALIPGSISNLDIMQKWGKFAGVLMSKLQEK